MLVATDHLHYITQASYSAETSDFDFRNGQSYKAGTTLTYRTGSYGKPIKLAGDYHFGWMDATDTTTLGYLLLEVTPVQQN